MKGQTKSKAKKQTESEPIGIVISGGPVRETQPVISAYVWGSAPEEPRKRSAPRMA